MKLFEANNICKNYARQVALNDVSISVPEQSIFGLLGPNGAGKTTLIRIINQITGPDKGTVFFKGEKLNPSHTKLIGYLPEERGLYKKMKVGEQALYLAQLKGLEKKDAVNKLKFWFEKFDILAWWDRKVEELSKGMQQKIQFIITVLHEPELLIFDEPFSGFDPINVNIIKEEILQLRNNGSTIIFSTHNMESVEELCDHIALIDKSEKILEGKVDEIKNTYKSNSYEFELNNLLPDFSLQANFSENYSILSEEKKGDSIKASIKINKETDPNKLVEIALKHGTLCSFKEILPTMNEIFIKKVNQ